MVIYETDSNKPTLSFVEDIPNGVVCICPFCNHEIAILDKKTEECPVCSSDLVYPSWCIW